MYACMIWPECFEPFVSSCFLVLPFCGAIEWYTTSVIVVPFWRLYNNKKTYSLNFSLLNQLFKVIASGKLSIDIDVRAQLGQIVQILCRFCSIYLRRFLFNFIFDFFFLFSFSTNVKLLINQKSSLNSLLFFRF